MKKKCILRFDLLFGSFYYCYDSKIGPYLSKTIANACIFDSWNSVDAQVYNLMKYFFNYSVEFSILFKS